MSEIKYVIGLDEVGCGALAGPLVVAAVAFATGATKVTATWHGIKADKELVVGDSKKMKLPAQRAVLAQAIKGECVTFAIIERTPREIDERLLGTVLPETVRLTAARCCESLMTKTRGLHASEILLIVDGDLQRPDVPCPVRMLPGGDGLDWRVGAASIIAKATHDVRIEQLANEHPKWDFDKHRGYPTPTHKELLRKRGLIEEVHRKSFGPVRSSRGPIPGFEE